VNPGLEWLNRRCPNLLSQADIDLGNSLEDKTVISNKIWMQDPNMRICPVCGKPGIYFGIGTIAGTTATCRFCAESRITRWMKRILKWLKLSR